MRSVDRVGITGGTDALKRCGPPGEEEQIGEDVETAFRLQDIENLATIAACRHRHGSVLLRGSGAPGAAGHRRLAARWRPRGAARTHPLLTHRAAPHVSPQGILGPLGASRAGRACGPCCR